MTTFKHPDNHMQGIKYYVTVRRLNKSYETCG